MIWPLPGVSGQALRDQLRPVADDATNVFGLGGTAGEVVQRYLKWVADAERMLRTVMRPEDMHRYVLTDRYWATLRGALEPKLILSAVLYEMQHVARELAAALRDLDQYVTGWLSDEHLNRPVSYVVPDTNVFMQHPRPYPGIDWHEALEGTVQRVENIRVIVPILVVDELDNLKRTNERSRARQTLKAFYDDFGGGVDGRRILHLKDATIGEVTVQLLLDPPDHVRLPIADDELVDRAATLQSFINHLVHFVTYDTGAAFRASAAGLRQHRLEEANGSSLPHPQG